MCNNEFSTGTLAQVATVLAKEYGIRIRIGGSGAYTFRDTVTKKWTINIPSLTTQDKFYTDIVRCYLDHEAGHVRFSDMDFLNFHKGILYIQKQIWNIFEDVRIEKKMSRSFPGCARNLRVGAERIFSCDIDPTTDIISALLGYILAAARYSAAQSNTFKSLCDTYSMLLISELKNLVDTHVAQLASCSSTKDTFRLAASLFNAIKNYVKTETDKQQSVLGNREDSTQSVLGNREDSTHSAGGDASAGNAESDENSSEQGNDSSDGSASSTPAPDEESLGDIPDSPSDNSGASGKRLSDMDTTEAALDILTAAVRGDCEGDKSYDVAGVVGKLLSDVTDESAGDAVAFGTIEWKVYKSLDELAKSRKKNYIGKLSGASRNAALKESAKLSSQLAGLLQTMTMNRGGFATRGRIDPHRLARIAVGRPDIFSSRVDKKGLDTEVILAVDFSGSMDGVSNNNKLLFANQALMAVLVALKGIQGVRSMAYMYSDFIVHVCGFNDNFTRDSRMVVEACGSTPTGDAVQYAMTQFTPQAKRRILLLLTDGAPDSSTYFKHSVAALKRQGIEIVGIGIQDESLSRDMDKHEHIIVRELPELSPKLFKILQDKLVHNA